MIIYINDIYIYSLAIQVKTPNPMILIQVWKHDLLPATFRECGMCVPCVLWSI